MKKKLIDLMEKYGKIFIIFCILIMAMALILSYVKPRQALDTYEINMQENNDYNIEIDKATTVEYYCDTGEKPLNGVQMGITRQGHEYTDGRIVCTVFKADDKSVLGSVSQNLNEILQVQYVYFPFTQMTQYSGNIIISFTYEGNDTEYPAIIANDNTTENSKTLVNGREISGSLKAYYIYSHNTYPLVFDLKIFLAIFITVFFTLPFGNKKNQKAELPL